MNEVTESKHEYINNLPDVANLTNVFEIRQFVEKCAKSTVKINASYS